MKKKELTADQWTKYPVRQCYTMHECRICRMPIIWGESYWDGGYGRRAHTICVAYRVKEDGDG